jgi:hypothetical protein
VVGSAVLTQPARPTPSVAGPFCICQTDRRHAGVSQAETRGGRASAYLPVRACSEATPARVIGPGWSRLLGSLCLRLDDSVRYAKRPQVSENRGRFRTARCRPPDRMGVPVAHSSSLLRLPAGELATEPSVKGKLCRVVAIGNRDGPSLSEACESQF